MENPLIMLSDGVSIRHSQNSNETTYFKWYNGGESDIKVHLQVDSGSADLFINTLHMVDEMGNILENLADKLPSSSLVSHWAIEKVTPVDHSKGNTIILAEDKDYCQYCWFLLGVKTPAQQGAHFILSIQPVEEGENEQMLLKVGEAKLDRIEMGQEKIYEFMLDHKEKAEIDLTCFSGKVSMSLRTTYDDPE